MANTTSLHPGFMIVHGNRLDDLRSLVVSWMRRYPLRPLENEVALVQSNGIAQWLKLALAEDPQEDDLGGCGIAAAIDVQLPGSFMWQLYRKVLGRDEIPEVSLLDKAPLTWRLMRLLPELIERPHFEPLRRFLTDDADLRKRYQLAERLADLFDQYQVYRADWLKDWAAAQHVLNTARGERKPLAPGNRWQAELWRALLEDVGEQGMAQSRAGVHQRFIEHINSLEQPPAGLPSRVIVFGISSLPAQALEALAGLARFSQVLLCVHNPCRHHWADIVADKDLLRHQYKRQQAEHAAWDSVTMRHRPTTASQSSAEVLHGYHRNDQRADCQQHRSALHERLAECPQCGFSARASQAVMGCGEKFAYVDILQNPEIRANLPKYANWPTFPQLWVAGELVGGSDIMLEMFEKGELQTLIKDAAAKAKASEA